MEITEDMEQNMKNLVASVDKITTHFLNSWLDKFPDVRRLFNFRLTSEDSHLYDELRPTSSLELHDLMKGMRSREEEMPEIMEEIKRNPEFSDFHYILDGMDPFHTKLKQKVKELVDNLTEEQIDTLHQRRDNIDEYRRLWQRDSGVFMNTMFGSTPALQEKIPFASRWFVLIDTYLRDMELLYKLVIDPAWQYSNRQSGSYNQKIEFFFDSDPDLKQTLEEQRLIIPWLRHKIAHQQYIIDLKDEKLIFFADPEWQGQDPPKSIDFDKIDDIVVNFNLFVLTVVTHLEDYSSDKFGIVPDSIKQPLGGDQQIIQRMVNLDTFNSIRSTGVIEEYLDHINLSMVFLAGYEEGKISRDLYYQAQGRILYLQNYNAFKEFILKPMYTTLTGSNDFKYSRDEDILNSFHNSTNNKFERLTKEFRPDIRNNISHLNYKIDDPLVPSYHPKEPFIPLIAAMELMNVMHQFDIVLDPITNNFPLFNGTAELLANIFKTDTRTHHDVKYFFEAGKVLLKQKGYQIISAISFLVAAALSKSGGKNRKMLISKSHKILLQRSKKNRRNYELFQLYAFRISLKPVNFGITEGNVEYIANSANYLDECLKLVEFDRLGGKNPKVRYYVMCAIKEMFLGNQQKMITYLKRGLQV